MTTLTWKQRLFAGSTFLKFDQPGGDRATAVKLVPSQVSVRRRELVGLLSMLSMLLDNGLPLPRALDSLIADKSCRKHRPMLRYIRGRVSGGETLSQSLGAFSKFITPAMQQQIALAEASGTLIDSLRRISNHLEESIELRRKLVQKLSYPLLVIVAGSGLMVFMLAVVVPQFEKIYAESKVALPWVTSFITALSRSLSRYLWLLPVAVVLAVMALRSIRRSETASAKFDYWLLKLPGVGSFLIDLSALEFLRSTLVLSEAGFVPLEAITKAARGVPNRYIREVLSQVAAEVGQGRRISDALRSAEDLFPNAVLQLIIVGEQTGGLTQAAAGACQIVRSRFDQRMNSVLAALEPMLTISLAVCIGWLVLAIYMPMFHMFDVLDME